MAGWIVTALVGDHTNSSPLTILGADAVDVESVLKSGWRRRPPPQGIVVAADLYALDTRVRRGVGQAVSQRWTEVTLWGDSCPGAFDYGVDPLQYQLSPATRAFKVRALAAAGDPEATLVGDTESFHRGLIRQPYFGAELADVG